MAIQYITAQEARAVSDAINEKGSFAVYDDIQSVLGTGLYHIFTEYPISEVTRKNLIDKGYKVEDLPQIAIQRDGIYHKVSW